MHKNSLVGINNPEGYFGRVATCKDNSTFSFFTGVRSNTKIRKIFKYILDNGQASKYDLVTNVLKKEGTRKTLKGYWCTNFAALRNSGLLNYDYETKKYNLTTKSLVLVADRKIVPEAFL